jgi:hypothetical protein
MTVELTGAVKINESASVTKLTQLISQSITGITEYSSFQIVVDKSAVDLEVPMALMTPCKFFYISTDQEIDVKLNGATEVVTIPVGGMLSMHAAITTASITNNSSELEPIVKIVIAA